jgi:hypothetical protein
MRKIFNYTAIAAVALSLSSCFNLEEKAFNRIEKDNFYQNEGSVKGAVASVYYTAEGSFGEYFFYLNEFSADQIAWRVWNGGQWGWDNAEKFVLSSHTWTSESVIIRNAWNNTWGAIGEANSIIHDLETLDLEAIGLDPHKASQYVDEMKTLRAWCYYNLFEIWGGALPLNTEVTSEVPPTADPDFDTSCKIIWQFLIDELDASLPGLPKNSVNRMNQATNRMIKARLMFNAEVFIKENHYSEAAAICDEILAGNYGTYSLASDYRDIFNIDNVNCPEVIFALASEHGKSHGNAYNCRNVTFFPYNAFGDPESIFGSNNDQGRWNCVIIAPSHDNSGTVLTTGGTDTGGKSFLFDYGDKLGAVYDRFDNRDIRKKPFHADEKGNWEGSFLMGPQKDYYTGAILPADADRDGQELVYVDQVGTFQNKGRDLATVMSPHWGETNSGYRLVKYPVLPDVCEVDFRDIDEVEFRLAEVYYMLAECKLRSGDSEGAKELVNQVRKRYFTAVDWNTVKDEPGPGFTAFDEDWMLNEWGKEFLCEGRRRRTDLRRFDKFTQGQWWFFGRGEGDDFYPAQRDRKYEWYPLPEAALTVNPGLVQNPNYVAQ